MSQCLSLFQIRVVRLRTKRYVAEPVHPLMPLYQYEFHAGEDQH